MNYIVDVNNKCCVLVVFVVQTVIRGLHTADLRPPWDPCGTAGEKYVGAAKMAPLPPVHLTWITGKIMHARMPAMLCFCKK